MLSVLLTHRLLSATISSKHFTFIYPFLVFSLYCVHEAMHGFVLPTQQFLKAGRERASECQRCCCRFMRRTLGHLSSILREGRRGSLHERVYMYNGTHIFARSKMAPTLPSCYRAGNAHGDWGIYGEHLPATLQCADPGNAKVAWLTDGKAYTIQVHAIHKGYV